ncbi:DNA polymerase [bacterium]|nr:DNA polymerase [bacterium]
MNQTSSDTSAPQISYTLLQPVKWKPRPNLKIPLEEIPHEEVYAIDIETTGLDPHTDTIVGLAIAGDFGTTYIDTRSPSILNKALGWLRDKKWVAHNSVFDGSFIVAAQHRLWGGEFMDYTQAVVGDTLVAFRLFANEGWPGQRHNLGVAIDTLLGWEGNQKNVLDELLIKHSLKKGEMGKLADLEPEAFAEYGAMDAEAAYQLMIYFDGYFDVWPGAAESYEAYKVLIQLIIEQKLRGILIDVDRLTALQSELMQDMSRKEKEFRSFPKVREYLASYESDEGEQTVSQHVTKKIKAKKSDTPWKSTQWIRDIEREPTAVWEQEHGTWCRYESVVKVKIKKVKEVKFNIQSKAHLRKLFFDHLGYTPEERTETGLGKVDKKILPKLGELGQLLASYNKDLKLLGYVNRVFDKLDGDILRFDLDPHGTMTGRCRGRGGINIQQLTKDERYLRCFINRPGQELVDTDFTSLENVVLAEASNDPGLMELYGSGKPHDSYLYVACFIFPNSGLAEVYIPDNPTVESVAEAKKQFKPLRTIAKVVVLSSNYGAGAEKIHQTLVQSGVDITLEEVEAIRAKYWQLFAGVKEFEKRLHLERARNDGWILNGLGRPMCITQDKSKDIVNVYCQSVGVGILHRYLVFVDKLRRERGIPMYPWVVDFHDQTTAETSDSEGTALIFKDAYVMLNEYLNPVIPMKGDIDIGTCMWDFKQ